MRFVILSKDHRSVRDNITIEKIDAPDEEAAWDYITERSHSDMQSWPFTEEEWTAFKALIATEEEPWPESEGSQPYPRPGESYDDAYCRKEEAKRKVARYAGK